MENWQNSYILQILPTTVRNWLTKRPFVADFPIVVGTIYLFKGHLQLCSLVILQPQIPLNTYSSNSSSRRIHIFWPRKPKYLGPIVCSAWGSPLIDAQNDVVHGGSMWTIEEWLICTRWHSWTSTSCRKHTGLARFGELEFGDITNNPHLIDFYYSPYLFRSLISWECYIWMEKATFGRIVSNVQPSFTHVFTLKCNTGLSEKGALQIQLLICVDHHSRCHAQKPVDGW